MIPMAPAVEALLRAASQARARGDGVSELRLLDDAVQRYPDSPHASNARGMRALADQDARAAAGHFARAVRSDPSQPALHVNLATAHRTASYDAGERAALESVLALDRTHFVANLRMAELLARTGEAAKAAFHWGGVVQLAQAMAERPPLVADALLRGQAFLAQHQARFAQALDREFGALDAEDHRFQACVDHMLGRRRIFQNQCAGVYYPFLPADEFFHGHFFPWFAELEARTDAIRREALAILANRSDAVRPYVRQERGTPKSKWSALDHSLDWGACFLWEYGVRNDAVCDLCPETATALERVPRNHVPGKAPSAFFSILQPGAHIPPHTGVTNTRAIVHLPLVVPEGCTFRVGGETRRWREGEAFAFDDTIEHEAWNPTDTARVILILDVWNPHLTHREQDRLEKLFAVADRDTVSVKAG
jgi:aspartyl/asparaginyl beta-hydroxylase (cupin superfamily)